MHPLLNGAALPAIAAAALAVVVLGMPTESVAKNQYEDRAVYLEKAKSCPPRWQQGNGNFETSPLKCYPQYNNSPAIYRNGSGSCKSGYGNYRNEWCVKGHEEHPQLANPHVMAKANKGDRCPAGFHTYMDKCTTDYARPAKARPKGNNACKAGEIAEWGIWCTSGYEHLSVQDIRSAHYRDWNNIYAITGGRNPRQGPGDEDASEVYKAMFGDDRLDGPLGKANAALVNKRPLTTEQRQLLANANAATAAMLPPESAAQSTVESGTPRSDTANHPQGDAGKPECGLSQLGGSLGQMAGKMLGC